MIILMGSIIHKSGAPTHTGYLSTTHNQACVPANPEVDRKYHIFKSIICNLNHTIKYYLNLL